MSENLSSNKPHGFALRTTLIVSIIIMILLGSISVGVLAFISSKKIVNDLWEEMSTQIGKNAIDQIATFFNQAEPATQELLDLLQGKLIDIDNDKQLLEYFYHALQINPAFQWMFLDRLNDTAVAAFYATKEAAIHFWLQKGPHTELFKYGKDNSFELLQKITTPTNKELPIYNLALKHPSGIWGEPYLYKTIPGIGIDFGRGIYIDGEIKGIVAIEYELSQLKLFFESLKIYASHQIYLVNAQGDILLDSDKDYAKESVQTGFTNIKNKNNPDLKEAWESILKQSSKKGVLHTENALGFFEKVPMYTSTPWIFVMLISKHEFYEPIRMQTHISFFIVLSICSVCILLSLFFFSRISCSLKTCAEEMYRLTQFNFSKQFLASKLTWIREVNALNIAIDHLKQGLQSFAKYVPVELVSSLIKTNKPLTISGEKKDISVLFVDLISFNSFTKTCSANTTMKILGTYLSAMCAEIESTGGIVDKYVGDGLMALWGAPKPLENHALMACRAALKMQKKLQALQKTWTDQGKIELHHRIGINTGDAIVGNIGSETKMEYTAIGDTINLASRLESINKEYGSEITISPFVANLVSKEMLLRPIDFAKVRGKRDLILIYELICPLSEASDAWIQAVETHSSALYAYRDHKLQEAAKLFSHVSEILGFPDKPSMVMARKCYNPNNERF
ncbi:MAG: adenylate/guanylate cyclase domain-containing protein [Chlamydiales bacterium]|nr:adenylate/guanylate cyclase domain-containing protein [Chlamydiales bacterium]